MTAQTPDLTITLENLQGIGADVKSGYKNQQVTIIFRQLTVTCEI